MRIAMLYNLNWILTVKNALEGYSRALKRVFYDLALF
jgi:hypothetical protein